MKRPLIILALCVVGAAANATVFVFSSGAIGIPDVAATMTNYAVSGLDGPIVDVDFRINGISHTFPDDIGAVLANNIGQTAILFDGPGGGTDIQGLTWLFDDSASAPLPNVDPLVSGSFLPGQNQYNDVFTNIAGPFGTTMAGLNGGGNGSWVLHVEDFVGGDFGSINSSDLIITTNPIPEPASMIALGLGALALVRRRRSK